MKTVRIIALHLDFGGIEKAICSIANMFAERCEVEIISVYNMPNAPAYPLDDRIRVRYLLDDVPNRTEWKAALRARKPAKLVKESFRALKILVGKRLAVIKAIKNIEEGVLICTRHEDNILLSKYGHKEVLKIAQLHHDHRFNERLLNGFKNKYRNIDYFAQLTPKLQSEVRDIMRDNKHTKVVYVPNFLEYYPDMSAVESREKTILAVGRLTPVKGFDRLINIFSHIHAEAPDWKLRIIGDGEEREKLEECIISCGLSGYVELPGRMDSKGVEEEMKKASVYAMTSLSEGLPFVLMEAQSCGMPIVAFDVRVGPAAVVENNVDGFLVEDECYSNYEGMLLKLINDEELRKKMGKAAIISAQEYSKENVAKKWFSIIGE